MTFISILIFIALLAIIAILAIYGYTENKEIEQLKKENYILNEQIIKEREKVCELLDELNELLDKLD